MEPRILIASPHEVIGSLGKFECKHSDATVLSQTLKKALATAFQADSGRSTGCFYYPKSWQDATGGWSRGCHKAT